jgi:hypothetical protein
MDSGDRMICISTEGHELITGRVGTLPASRRGPRRCRSGAIVVILFEPSVVKAAAGSMVALVMVNTIAAPPLRGATAG